MSRLGDRSHRILLLLTDAGAGDQQEVLRGAYRTAGAGVPLVGGACPSPAGNTRGWQLHDGQVVHGAVVVTANGSDAPSGRRRRSRPGAGRRADVGDRQRGHRDPRTGRPPGPAALPAAVGASRRVPHGLRAARCGRAGHRLGRGRVRAVGGHAPTGLFVRSAAMHPLGLRRRSGALVRSVVGADPVRGSLVCAAEVPQGALVWLMYGSTASILKGLDRACEQALAGLGPGRACGPAALRLRRPTPSPRGRRRRPVRRAAASGRADGGARRAGAPRGRGHRRGVARVQGLTDFHAGPSSSWRWGRRGLVGRVVRAATGRVHEPAAGLRRHAPDGRPCGGACRRSIRRRRRRRGLVRGGRVLAVIGSQAGHPSEGRYWRACGPDPRSCPASGRTPCSPPRWTTTRPVTCCWRSPATRKAWRRRACYGAVRVLSLALRQLELGGRAPSTAMAARAARGGAGGTGR